MNEFNLNSISPIDGRYSNKTEALSQYFSEKALIFYRLKVEIEYFISLCEIPLPELKSFKKSDFKKLREMYENFSEKDAIAIKEIEKKTNHDVKAVEYFIKNEFDKLNININSTPNQNKKKRNKEMQIIQKLAISLLYTELEPRRTEYAGHTKDEIVINDNVKDIITKTYGTKWITWNEFDTLHDEEKNNITKCT